MDFNHSMPMQIAERQASATDEQAWLIVGEVDENSKCCIVALFPLVDEVISHCDSFPSEVVRDPFPSKGNSGVHDHCSYFFEICLFCKIHTVFTPCYLQTLFFFLLKSRQIPHNA